MKFRNVTDETREVTSLGIYVEPGGETPDLDDGQAAGFLHQDEVWHAVGEQARAEQQAAIEAAERAARAAAGQRPDPPAKSASKADWVDYAVAVETAAGADPDEAFAAADALTVKQLVAEYGKKGA